MESVAVIGLGKTGALAAKLLSKAGFDVTGIDAHAGVDLPFKTDLIDLSNSPLLGGAFAGEGY